MRADRLPGVSGVSVLEREMYSEAEAARLLGVAQSTLNYWLEGGTRRGRVYRPVIRPEPRGERAPVTWAELIEAGLLRSYRRDRNVPMAELRVFIDRLRDRYGIPYPLADRRPFVLDRQLLHQAQDLAGLDPEFCLVAEVRGRLVLTPRARTGSTASHGTTRMSRWRGGHTTTRPRRCGWRRGCGSASPRWAG